MILLYLGWQVDFIDYYITKYSDISFFGLCILFILVNLLYFNRLDIEELKELYLDTKMYKNIKYWMIIILPYSIVIFTFVFGELLKKLIT